MAGKKRGMSIYHSLTEQVEFPCLGMEICASAGRSVSNLGQGREEWREWANRELKCMDWPRDLGRRGPCLGLWDGGKEGAFLGDHADWTADGQRTEDFLHQARMDWGKFVFWPYFLNILLPAILIICLLLFLFTDSNCLPGSSSWFCLVMSHSCRCQRHFSVPVWKHRWARSALRLWPAQDLSEVFWPCSATLCATWQTWCHLCQSYCGRLAAVFSFKDFAPGIKGLIVICFPPHM